MTDADGPLVVLRAAGTSLVLDVAGDGLPAVLHWGADVGDLDAAAAAELRRAMVAPVPRGGLDAPWRLPVLPGERDGWSGTPGLSGHRAGADTAPALALSQPVEVAQHTAGGEVQAIVAGSGITLDLSISLDAHGIVHVDTTITNDGDGVYDLAAVLPLLPLPPWAGEVLDLTGRWCRERSPQRAPLQFDTHLRSGRRGRSGHDAPLLLTAGTPGFGFRRGEVWATHCAWSGDATHLVERLPEGAGGAAAVLGSGELLRPGEVRLAPGEAYRAPTSLFGWSDAGLDGLSARFHAMLRARPGHPQSPRPVLLNTWEAVYFDHDLERLERLADAAAAIGVERFVVDDGWFGSRRDDTSGLGDWYVSTDAWPRGLGPLVEHVRGVGMQFGLWFEPEMANPDSDLVRAHPEWVLTPDAPSWRHEVAIDLAQPAAFEHVLERLDALVTEYGIDYIKWDHNRDLHAALHIRADGTRVPGVHEQTRALYRLLDTLRERHPGLEIESCASGGGRVDLGMVARTDRVWTSDNTDARERQHIQRWTSLLLPPELIGAHVGPSPNPVTGRELSLAFRCVTALFGHAGLEWDLTRCDDAELAALTRWIELYKQLRPLLHGGDTVRAGDADLGDDTALLHGVVARDGGAAVFAYARLDTAPALTPGRVRLPGLDPDATYRVRAHNDESGDSIAQRTPPPWLDAGATLAGIQLGAVGLPMPVLAPGAALLIELHREPLVA